MTTNYQTGDQSSKDIKDKLKQDVGNIKQDVGNKARQAKQQLADKGREKAENLQSKAADTLQDVEAAADAEADALEELGWDNLSGYIREMADGIGGLSENLRNKSVDELVHTAAELARRNTGLFVLGSVAIGFGLSRFAKASSGANASDSWPSAQRDESDSYSYAESGSSFASDAEDYSAGGATTDPYRPYESSTPASGGYPPYESSTDQKQPFDRH